MAARGGVYVEGEVLDVEFKQGNQGTDRAYAFHVVSILAGKTVHEVKWDSRNIQGQPPKEGDRVALACELGVYSGRLQVNAKRVEKVEAAPVPKAV